MNRFHLFVSMRHTATALLLLAAASKSWAQGFDKINTTVTNVNTILVTISIAVVTIAIIWAGFKMIFQGARLAEQHAGCRGHALAALELEEHRPEVPDEGAQAHQRHHGLAQAQLQRHQHRHIAFQGIEHQGQDGRALVARAQHIGRTGVARPVTAGVRQSEQATDDHRKRERADQVTDNRREDAQHQGVKAGQIHA